MAPKKSHKMSLGTFLQDETLGSWADEMEDMPLPSTDSRTSYGTERRNFSAAPSMGNGMDRRDGYPPREQLPLPTQPPYTAHLANLSFDVTQGEVGDFFRECEVTNVRIVEDKIDRKPKGFGYVEFASLDGLKKALSLSGAQLNSRNIRVSVAEPPKERQDTRDFNWERKGPLPELANQNRRVSDRPGYGGRNFDAASDAGSERGGRRNMDQGDGKVRDFSSWERRGPLSPVTAAPLSLREGGRQGSKESTGFRRNSPAWGEGRGEGRSQDGSRPPKKEFQEKPTVERAPTASEMDNQWRSRMRPDAPAKSPTPETSAPSSPVPVNAAPATRPRLQLQKRTVSEAVDPASSPATATESKASPFGAARPVDTAAKEREVAEKREIALRQKREADEKSKAEKADEKRQSKEKEKIEAAREKDPHELEAEKLNNGKDTEEESTPATPKFDLLRRADSNTNDMVAPEEVDEEGEEEAIVDDRAVKPKEITRETRPTKANGAWRKDGQQSPKPQTTAQTMEEDGWSTVGKPTKQRNNRRNNNMPTRALAS